MKKQRIIQQVLKNYILQLKIVGRKTKKPIIIAMVGLIGSGRELIAEELSKLTKATVISADDIRVALRKQKQDYRQIRNLVQKAAAYVIKKGGNVILDSDFIHSQKRKILEEKIKRLKGKVFYIRTFADRDTMIERLIKTKYNPNRDLFKNNTIAAREMWRRTPHHYRWEEKEGGRFVLRKLRINLLAEISTDGNWKSEVKEIAQKIKKM